MGRRTGLGDTKGNNAGNRSRNGRNIRGDYEEHATKEIGMSPKRIVRQAVARRVE